MPGKNNFLKAVEDKEKSICIAPDKEIFSTPKLLTVFLFIDKKYVVGTHQKSLIEEFLTRTHNICFRGEIRKILPGYPLLSGAMYI